ncbi:MAG: hypothetical protein IKJ94_07300 [Oscillospiraceae bacterium]|nr:hypothetical protein [Oscillospiraceae bacterium]
MKKRILYIVWLWLYLLCAALGHTASPTATQQAAMTCLSVIFFIPGFWLLIDFCRRRDKKGLSCLFFISLASLALTFLLLLANLLSVTGPEALGNVLYVLLIWLSSPMVCSGYWFLSLFLWAILLFSAITCKKKL